MTQKRQWMALAALTAALVAGTVVADDARKATPKCDREVCDKPECCPGCPATRAASVAPPAPCPSGACCQQTLPCPTPVPFAFYQNGPFPAPPAPPPMMPETWYTPVTTYVAQPMPPSVAPPMPSGTWHMRVVTIDGKPAVETCMGHQGSNNSLTADCLTLKVNGEAIKVCAVGKQIQVKGKCVEATADGVTHDQGGGITLVGHVKLKYDGAGQKAEVTADSVHVGLPGGRLVVSSLPGASQAVRPPQDKQQIFDFFIGTQR